MFTLKDHRRSFDCLLLRANRQWALELFAEGSRRYQVVNVDYLPPQTGSYITGRVERMGTMTGVLLSDPLPPHMQLLYEGVANCFLDVQEMTEKIACGGTERQRKEYAFSQGIKFLPG